MLFRSETFDYKSTLNLPKTDFPMRAGLPKREPEWLARWEDIGVYDRLREKQDRTPFTLHDGPPYANGHLHIGHALNKIGRASCRERVWSSVGGGVVRNEQS